METKASKSIKVSNETLELLKAHQIKNGLNSIEEAVKSLLSGVKSKDEIINANTHGVETKDKLDLFFDAIFAAIRNGVMVHHINAATIFGLTGINAGRNISPYLSDNQKRLDAFYTKYKIKIPVTSESKEANLLALKDALKAAGLTDLFPKSK